MPPLSPSRDMNLEDLELLHQYMTSTSITTGQLPDARIQMQRAVPQLAQTYHFVMRGILAKAAIHLSWLRPYRKQRYAILAAKHHDAAFPEFRSALQQMNQHNYRALILYSKGLVWCSFAWCETLTDEHRTLSCESGSSWLPRWFHLLRGSCLVVEACKPWIESGLYLSPPPLEDDPAFTTSLDNCRLAALEDHLLPQVESPICEVVLSGLQEAFARAALRHHNTPLRNAMNYWMGMLPNEYLEALQDQTPWALVVLAHFCILVSRSETRWFMKGHGAKLLHSTLERLPKAWKEYTEWPREEVQFWTDLDVSAIETVLADSAVT